MPVRRSTLPALLLLTGITACSDYEFGSTKNTAPSGSDTGSLPGEDGDDGGSEGGGETGDDGGVTPPEEECNGIDDDGDGDVDEGFPDTDGDGVADCLDTECTVDGAVAAEVAIDDTCIAPANMVTDPWDVGIEWQWSSWSGNPSIAQVIAVPVVGNLVDTNTDGVVDELDTPNIVVVAFSYSDSSSRLVVLDGASGIEQWAVGGVSPYGGIALADVDGDGWTDVLAVDNSGRPVAYRGDGSLLWQSTAAISTSYYSYPQVAVADLDADGVPEVLVQEIVVDGATGALELSGLGPSSSVPYWIPTAADLDQDGDQELIHGDRVYDSNGTLLWQAPFSGTYGHWAAVLDYDGDPEAEIAMIGGGYLGIYEADGTERVRTSLGASQPGAPCVADFDGDGDAEIAWASQSVFQVAELSGSLLWSATISDYSGLASCSGYDVDGDGVYEVLYADENTFWIFDGATGTVRFSQGGHSSGTLWEYPAIADVDNDGSAEVVIGSNNYATSGWTGITVFGHNGSGWMKSGPTWHTHDFAVTNINTDGTVPARPQPWWQIYNVYRARPAVDTAALDLLADIVDVCAASCEADGEVLATVQVSNAGGVDSGTDISVALYADNGGTLSLIDTQLVPGPVPGGRSLDSILFSFPAAQLGADGLVAVVDDDGTGAGSQDECVEADNADSWTDPVCP